MQKIIKILLASVVFLYAGFSFADNASSATITTANVVNTPAENQATVAVTDRSATALQLAVKSAFSEVIVKMSGNPTEMNAPVIQKASGNLMRWVQSYAYVEQPNINSNAQPQLSLQVVFDQKGLQQLLKKATQKVVNTQNAVTSQTVTLIVSGVKSAADYVQVMQALRAKNDVTDVSVGKVHGDEVSLNVKIAGSNAQFQKLLSTDNNFKSVDVNNPSKLDYYWMGNQA